MGNKGKEGSAPESGTGAAPQSIVEAARAWLRSVGLPEPDEGWDRWEDPGDASEPSPARPTPRILRAEPMAIEEWAKPGGPGELVDGMLVEEKATAPPHDAVAAWLLNKLRAWTSLRGAVVLGPGHKLVVSTLGGRKPDICVYAAGDLPEGDATLSSRPPALVVEVSSPRKVDMRTDFITKQREYACRGVQRYWRGETAQRFLEGLELEPGERYGRDLGVTGGVLLEVGLAGLEIDLDDLWAEVESHLSGARGETL